MARARIGLEGSRTNVFFPFPNDPTIDRGCYFISRFIVLCLPFNNIRARRNRGMWVARFACFFHGGKDVPVIIIPRKRVRTSFSTSARSPIAFFVYRRAKKGI